MDVLLLSKELCFSEPHATSHENPSSEPRCGMVSYLPALFTEKIQAFTLVGPNY
jgi:hypothetical protein